MLKSLIGKVVDFRNDDELRGVLWAAAYGFLIMVAYYILRAVRDEISAEDRGNLQILWTVVFFVMVFVAVPFSSHEAMLRDLAGALEGKTVVDVVVPMEFHRGRASRVEVEEGSAAQQAQAILPGSTVVGAFHTTSAEDLLVPGRSLDSDVVVCADDRGAKEAVMKLVEMIEGARAVDGGGLRNAAFVEGFTVLLMDINRIYRAHAAIRIVGI